MLRREADVEGADHAVLAALGWTRGDTLRLALLRGAALGVLGAIAGAAVAVTLSPLFPIGIGRIADPDVGWHLDAAVVVGGMHATVVCVAALAVILAARADFGDRVNLSARLRCAHAPRSTAGDDGRTRVSRPSGRRGAGTRLSILSLVAVTALLAATLLTVASFDYLARHRELAGATWSAVVLPPPDAAGNIDVEAALEQVRAVPGVEAATSGGWASSGLSYDGRLVVDGHAVEGQIFGDDGRDRTCDPAWPSAAKPARVALGSKVRCPMRLHIGDRVTVGARRGRPDDPRPVVGEVVLASPYFISFAPGTGSATVVIDVHGAWRTVDLALDPAALRARRRPARTFNAVESALGHTGGIRSGRPRRLDRTRPGTRRPDRARRSGCSCSSPPRSPTSCSCRCGAGGGPRRAPAPWGSPKDRPAASLIVHGSLIAVVVCAIGIPLGVVVGRAAWMWIAGEFFVVSVPVVPVLLLAALTLVLVVLASAAALVPAARAAHARPATVLRTH